MKSLLEKCGELSIAILLVVLFSVSASAQVPEIGSQVGLPDDPQQIDSLFKILYEHNMPVARIWVTLDPFSPEKWDFSKYDAAFNAAEKYGVGICPTLGPAGTGVSVMLKNREDMHEARHYIKTVVNRYKDHPALDTWMLLNEPGTFPATDPLPMSRFRDWLREKYGSVDQMWGDYASFEEVTYRDSWEQGPSRAFVDWYTFWRFHMTWYLDWIGSEVRKYDKKTQLHANGHSLISNVTNISTDLPSWRAVLDHIGGSMHPSWHFGGILDRDQYALGAAYESALLRGSAEPKPFWITELQGGNNLYRPAYPFHPTEKDIAQFLWTIIGSGADRAIFWTLNADSDWSLLDFQGRPSERIKTAGQIAKIVNKHSDFFAGAEPVTAPVTIMLSLETMTLQLATEGWNIDVEEDHIGRKRNAHVLSALAYYEAFQELGIPVRIKHMHDFGWNRNTGESRMIILPHVTSVTKEQAEGLETFVTSGNTLLASGLTGIYDQYRDFWPTKDDFPLQETFGGRYTEIRLLSPYGNIELNEPDVTLPYHLWVGEIEAMGSSSIGDENGWTTGTRHSVGGGESIWVPSLVGLGAWQKDNKGLTGFIRYYTGDLIDQVPFRFKKQCEGCVLRIMENEGRYVTVVTNGTEQPKRTVLHVKHPDLKADLLWGKKDQVNTEGNEIFLGPRETVVILWK
ncbi:beta-galactosidase [Halalkalibaculum sp. DA3122]|uniref:beta-galactosidase n=1 Tax=Halalkalibaculum sp. DA3122 TaxID=3373607 RepID=UPI003754F0F0